MKFSEFLFENNQNIVKMFLMSLSARELKNYSIRDNCGPAALDLISFAKQNNIELTRVRGEFKADHIVFDKADFTSQMKSEFNKTGLNWNSDTDRKKWIEQSKYFKDWHNIPHYWCVDGNGKIYDPTGELQFIKTGLSKDLNDRRYIVTEKK